MTKLFVVFFAALGTMGLGACAESLPARKECIVEVQLIWLDAVESDKRESAINEIAFAFTHAPSTLGSAYTSSIAIPRDSRAAIFVQFHENCDKKFQMADDIISRIQSDRRDLPQITVSRREIEPSTRTIDVRGPSWSE